MADRFIDTIISADPRLRDRSLTELCAGMDPADLLKSCEALEAFRRTCGNLYERVRATLFLFAIYRFHLMDSPAFARAPAGAGAIPWDGFSNLLARRFEEAIDCFRDAMHERAPCSSLLSALAETYHHLTFQTLLDQVRRSVRASRGNQWMFRVGHAADHPVRIHRALLRRTSDSLLYPVLRECTPVRLDLTHSGWSDIFFLGMDYPEAARVLNISIDLGVYGRDRDVRPPIEAFVRVVPEPVLRLTSVDLRATKDIHELDDLFNFGNDYLSLLKAGVIASGVVPPSFEGTGQSVERILERVVGPGMGLELATRVNDIPKGSRLAVSTNLLASIVGVLMRATGQVGALEGTMREAKRRLVASRAILGEWLGGSGGGWQDSGGIWPGIKEITGVVAREGDPEWGVSRGCLLPRHRLLGEDFLHPECLERLGRSLVLVHGGMAQDVGPILEMVTEKYLLRGKREWAARRELHRVFDGILEALRAGDIRGLARCTTRSFEGPLRTIIPWATNHFTETIIARVRELAREDYWGFLMLGGMSGGGMALFVAPERRERFRDEVLAIMREVKEEVDDALPFAMEPVVYDFAVNGRGSVAELLTGDRALMPPGYYELQVPQLVRSGSERISYVRRAEIDHFTAQVAGRMESYGMLRAMVGRFLKVNNPAAQSERVEWDSEAERMKQDHGFDPIQHEEIRAGLRAGRIGLAHNRLPLETEIEDVERDDYVALECLEEQAGRGVKVLRNGQVAVMTLAGGVGTRWTTGAGVIKALNPFVQVCGRHRSFLEIHLAKTSRTARLYDAMVPHIVSTSFLTHRSIARFLERSGNCGTDLPVRLSPGRSIGQRLIPMVRDLVFLWEEMPQERLDEQKQKVRDSLRTALKGWARERGEGSDYTDNVALQRFHPPGHWYEVPNLLRNGVLARMLRQWPRLRTIMLHNIDTLGADLDPRVLGWHAASGNVLTFEVVSRRVGDRGGGLARVGGRVRLLEGLAQPREEDEMRLRFYNSMTTWIEIDPLLELFGLTRDDLSGSQEKISAAVRRLASRIPTYVTIKDVKRRWGHGQEDVYPVAQFEKLWSDMTAVPGLRSGFVVVPRARGQQLKAPEELDAWANDGSKEYVESLCRFASW